MRTRIKICGLTRQSDAHDAVALGVDALGFVFAESPRQVSPTAVRRIVESLPPFVTTVAVVRGIGTDRALELAKESAVSMIQFHDETPVEEGCAVPYPWIQRHAVPDSGDAELLRASIGRSRARAHLIDPGAGDGVSFDWSIARDMPSPTFIAGGLTPLNVGDAIRAAQPFGVDVSGGVESSAGLKDLTKMSAFVDRVRRADGELYG
ncbi:MAG: phosphoribosylanthranilate isomerase [Acidobacteriota bacterium]|nr:phosphoribosylanthranilate isomerase [Acidobacteriota bacterium]MDH3784065.1 phosphoribosylanthranilate isomerase [Acidobacteriota bacterium]